MSDDSTGTGAAGEQAQPASFASAVAPGGEYTQAINIAGYLGENTPSGRAKLFLDAGLHTFAEFDPNDVVHMQPVPEAPLDGGVVVWLRPDAVVTHVQTLSQSIGSFMQGAMLTSAKAQAAQQVQALQGGSAGGMAPAFASIIFCDGGGGGGGDPTHYDSFFWCRSRFLCNPQSLPCTC